MGLLEGRSLGADGWRCSAIPFPASTAAALPSLFPFLQITTTSNNPNQSKDPEPEPLPREKHLPIDNSIQNPQP
jgi:hypothetical protein